jgi:hypothetical protein
MARTRSASEMIFKDQHQLAAKVLWCCKGDPHKAMSVLLETARTRKGAIRDTLGASAVRT